jgi:hypothetical protein
MTKRSDIFKSWQWFKSSFGLFFMFYTLKAKLQLSTNLVNYSNQDTALAAHDNPITHKLVKPGSQNYIISHDFIQHFTDIII